MTTKVLAVRNVNDALSAGLEYLLKHGTETTSRNGTVIVAPGPVITEYHRPQERVLFSFVRRANPFFHLMEALWMLAGRNDIIFPAYFNKRFTSYSDDGEIQHAAYGYRWRKWFNFDQIDWIIGELRNKPDSRRAVLAMWDGHADPEMVLKNGVDVPCNTHAYFEIRDNKLNMTVCCRSNDVIWGAYGANAVHFSVLQEYMARRIGTEIGIYRQMSNNFHVYTDVYPRNALEAMMDEGCRTNYYHEKSPEPLLHYPLVHDRANFDEHLRRFLLHPEMIHADLDPFLLEVAAPMYASWAERKNKKGNGMAMAGAIRAPDWRLACTNWIQHTDAEKEKRNVSSAA